MAPLIPRIESAKVGSKSLAYLIRPGSDFWGDQIRCDTGCAFILYAAFLLLVEVDWSVFWFQLSRMQVARLTTCLIVHCPDPPDSRRAWSSEPLALYECHYAWPLIPEVNSTAVCDFMILLSEGRMSPWTSRPRAQCPPVHFALVQTVPLCAECPPHTRRTGQNARGICRKKNSVEVSSIKRAVWKTI